jgi:hypothetical protein
MDDMYGKGANLYYPTFSTLSFARMVAGSIIPLSSSSAIIHQSAHQTFKKYSLLMFINPNIFQNNFIFSGQERFNFVPLS